MEISNNNHIPFEKPDAVFEEKPRNSIAHGWSPIASHFIEVKLSPRESKEFGSRSSLLHIKDRPAVKGDPMYKHVPTGEGTLDFPSIVKAGGENIC
jgi:hypothetical protein